ncbi:MAG: 5-histidylcysteine sulfoxide synthase [Oscillatoriales cyanobacterium CG2_30_44_21]|nr:MAG: 5-histidylcysteine sulfoxide synthase [Oscillatoriales cyanobacterium CG2_30_44_21]
MISDQSTQPPDLYHCDRAQIFEYFQRAWEIDNCLMKSVIDPNTFYTNPDPFRNLLIFYLGHSAVFYINKSLRVGLIKNGIHPDFEILFEMGVDPEKPDDIAGIFTNLRQVDVCQVWQYRQQVYECICDLIQNLKIVHPIHPEHELWALMMAIEHQFIHIETSSMLLRQLPVEQLRRPQNWQYAPIKDVASHHLLYSNVMLEVRGGIVKLGKPKDSSIYGWDIEYGDRLVDVDTFYVSKFLVTNADFLEFVKVGGYENPEYWAESAWQWKVEHNVHHPKFWIPKNNFYEYRAMFDEIELPLTWPVEVNHHEAIAYCRWLGNDSRLMTEDEWYLATYGISMEPHLISQEKTKKFPSSANYNLHLKVGSPSPVGSLDNAKNCLEISDLRGNVWEWLDNHLIPFAGYQSHALYENYSASYFDEAHYMMAGGSWITSGTEAEPYYRNWFRPSFYQHAGFRIASSSL